jgi:hypothetical protein
MKTNLLPIILFIALFFSITSCTKVAVPIDVSGRYISQDLHSPFGNVIELFNDNTAVVTANGFHYHYGYNFNGFDIRFSNGNIASLYGSNQLMFEESIEYLNTEYYDGDGDGYDDWDYTIPHYIWQTYQYYYYLQ